MTTSIEKPELFDPVESAMYEAILVAFDGCHKIYLAMDEHEANWFRENYEHVFMDTPEAMLEKVKEWYDESCFLRFVSAVRYNPDDPIAGFTSLISQFDDQDEDEDEDYDDEDDDDV